MTGGTGFAGTWLCRHLIESGDEIVTNYEGEITDAEDIRRALFAAEPEVVYHLAGQANVGKSWSEPGPTFRVNAEGTLNVVQAIAAMTDEAVVPRVLIVGSAEVYGRVAPEDMPVRENHALAPVSPYAASKLAAELVAMQAFRSNGVPVVIVRPFNHIGPGQADTFVVSAIAHRIVAAKRSSADFITVGNLESKRDFTDVRDIVAAYRLAVTAGVPGSVYNVSSGTSVSIATLAHRMVELAGGGLELRVDAQHRRAVDVPELLGDSSALRAATGWGPKLSIDDTLSDVLSEAGL